MTIEELLRIFVGDIVVEVECRKIRIDSISRKSHMNLRQLLGSAGKHKLTHFEGVPKASFSPRRMQHDALPIERAHDPA